MKKRKSLVVGALSGLVFFLTSISSATYAAVIFSDGEFSSSNWQSRTYYSDTGTSLGTVTTESSGGNPGAYREMQFRWNGGDSGPRRIDVFF